MDSAEFHAAVRIVLVLLLCVSECYLEYQVYEMVRNIPPLKVTSYGQSPLHYEPSRTPASNVRICIGHIAKLIGMPAHSRHVGQGARHVST